MHLGRWDRPISKARIVEGARQIGEEGHTVVAKHGVTRGGVTTVLRSGATDHHSVDTPFAKQQVEVGREEGAISVLCYDDLVLCGREQRIDFDSWGALDKGLPCCD